MGPSYILGLFQVPHKNVTYIYGPPPKKTHVKGVGILNAFLMANRPNPPKPSLPPFRNKGFITKALLRETNG